MQFLHFSGPWENCLKWHYMGPGGFFPTNPHLANILGDTDFDFENLYFLFVWIPNFQISRPGLGRAEERWQLGQEMLHLL